MLAVPNLVAYLICISFDGIFHGKANGAHFRSASSSGNAKNLNIPQGHDEEACLGPHHGRNAYLRPSFPHNSYRQVTIVYDSEGNSSLPSQLSTKHSSKNGTCHVIGGKGMTRGDVWGHTTEETLTCDQGFRIIFTDK